MSNWFFYLPFAYFLHTRVVRVPARISWLLIYFVPQILLLAVVSGVTHWLDWLWYGLGTIAIYSVYEWGYVENDSVTIRSEAKPTLRLSDAELGYLTKRWQWVFATRMIFATLIVGLFLVPVASKSIEGLSLFIVMLLMLAFVFALYNRTRGIANVLLHPVLVTIRFCAPILLIVPTFEIAVLGFLLFPMINSIERAAEPRYGLELFQKLWLSNQSSGRWSYYGILAVLLSVFIVGYQENWLLLIPVLYLFLYRVLTAVALAKQAER